MAKENSLEAVYTRQLQELGVYRHAFDPEIRLLCQMEREYRRLDRAWKAEIKGKPLSVSAKLYDARVKLRADILTHRDSLGLTPKGFKRLRPEIASASDATEGGEHPYAAVLAAIEARCAQYE